MYRIFSNRIFRIFMCIIFTAVFFVVPIEHKMLEAQAALAVSVSISIIVAILVAMGFTFGRIALSGDLDYQYSKGLKEKAISSLYQLAQDIYDNCFGITSALSACFPNGFVAFSSARLIIQAAPSLYQMIKKYIISKYGDTPDEIENNLNEQYGIQGKPFLCGGYNFYFNGICSARDCNGYSEMNIGGRRFYWEFLSVYNDVYTYKACYEQADGTVITLNKYETKDPSSLFVVGMYESIIAPNESYPCGAFNVYINYPFLSKSSGNMTDGPSKKFLFEFMSIAEYQAALKVYAGETDIVNMDKSVEVNDALFNSSVDNYPKYVYIHDNVDNYLGQTAADVASPAYSHIYDSEVVDNTLRTVTWQGDRTLCPIDELQGSLPTAVIGHWTATWDETSTLCNISCYAEDGTAVWTGEVATTLTWADVLARLGDIAITGAVGVAGSFALPDTALDFEPLKIAGDTFSKKFPFCLPFDLYNAFKQFDTDTEGKAPVYELPFNFGEQFGMHYVTIDMTKFTPLAKIVKWTVYVSFMLSLVVVTKKVLGGGS